MQTLSLVQINIIINILNQIRRYHTAMNCNTSYSSSLGPNQASQVAFPQQLEQNGAQSLSQAFCNTQQSQLSHLRIPSQHMTAHAQSNVVRDSAEEQKGLPQTSQFESPSQFIRSYSGLNFADQVAQLQEGVEAGGSAGVKLFERHEDELEAQLSKFGHKFVDPALFIDFTHFPTEFSSLEECLLRYNKLGLSLKIQFKRYNIRRNESGFVVGFSLCCAQRNPQSIKVNQGVQLKKKARFDCPVLVKFKWTQDRMSYLRSRALCMQHNHPLQVKDRATLLASPEMQKDIQHWVKCRVGVPLIVKLLNKKYRHEGALARYQDVYSLVKQITAQDDPTPTPSQGQIRPGVSLPSLSNEPSSEFVLLMEDLERSRKANLSAEGQPQMYFAYQLRSEKEQTDAESSYLHYNRGARQHVELADVSGLFFQLPSMRSNFKRFPELLFLDFSLRQKNSASENPADSHYLSNNYVFMPDYKSESPEDHLHVVVLSGLDADARNVVFGVALVTQLTYETFCWLLSHFRQANTPLLQEGSDPQPETVLTTMHQGLSQAIELVFSHRVVHLYCQASVKQFIKEHLARLLHPADHTSAAQKRRELSADLTKQWKNRHERRAEEMHLSLAQKKSDFAESGQSQNIAKAKQLTSQVLELVEESEQESFVQLQEAIFETAPELLDLHEVETLRLFFSQKEKWASAFTPPTFSCGTHSMNRALRIAKLLNSRLYGRCNLFDLFKLFEDFEGSGAYATELCKEGLLSKGDSHLVLHHPLLRELRLHCTQFAFQHLFYQYMHSHCMTVSLRPPYPQTQETQLADPKTIKIKVLDLRTREATTLIQVGSLDADSASEATLSCPCEFTKAFGLICAHAFAVLNVHQVKRIVRSKHLGLCDSLVRKRWMRRASEAESGGLDQHNQVGGPGGVTVDTGDADLPMEGEEAGFDGGRDNPYQIMLTTEMRLSGRDRELGLDLPLDGLPILN